MSTKPKRISIKAAKEIAELGYDEVIIVGCNYETGTQHVTTYGKSLAACENAARGGNAVKRLLKWPEEMCNAKPTRQKRKEKMDKRFNPDCSTFDEVVEYYKKRAIQLLRFDVVLEKIYEMPTGALAIFSYRSKTYHSLYLYPSSRGKGLYEEIMPKAVKIITSDDCGLEDYLTKKGYDFECFEIYSNFNYRDIVRYYGTRKAERSGVDYMNHIDEGLAVLKWIGLDEERDNDVFAAYALHPVFQADEDLKRNVSDMCFNNANSISIIGRQSKETILYAMEYRSVANEYLSKRDVENIEEIRLSPLKAVNDMLIADKIQNFKDFQIYHKGKHNNSARLDGYFRMWLKRLGISQKRYEEIKNKLIVNPEIFKI